MDERRYWNARFARADPWDYTSEYEQTKYRHTLDLLPDVPIASAIEVACAEGMFTAMLAPRVGWLLATDISDTAMTRAKRRCAGFRNVDFAQHDILQGMPGADYDLVVCSEVLYYLRDAAAIERVARQIRDSLRPGGHVLLTHANMVSDDRSQTGFDFNEIGAVGIGEIFARCPELEFARELRTELYRVQLFRRIPGDVIMVRNNDRPREIVLAKNADFEHATIKKGGCIVTAAEAKHYWVTKDVPILMYHRIANDGSADLAPYRLSPEAFERQLSWLQSNGFHSMSLDEYWKLKIRSWEKSIPGKPIILTFDDAYEDFYTTAWPLLRNYGFGATVFVPTDYVGGTADWDAAAGPPARIMSWDQIVELRAQGVEFGSHSRKHVPLVGLSALDVLRDAIASKRILKKKLGAPVRGFCYPFSTSNLLTRAMIVLAGYRYAVGGDVPQSSDRIDSFLIPRIEILGSDGIKDFVRKLPEPLPSDPAVRERYDEMRVRRDRATYMNH